MVFITVSDPRTEEEGTRQRFTSYLVSTDKGNSVRRSYNDFLWLYKRLQTELPGAVVPILPRSRALIASKKFDPDFIEERRRNLQQFLQGVVDHEELARAPSMSPFMVDMLGSDFEEGKKKVEARMPTNLLYTNQVEEDYGDGSAEKGAPTTTARKGLSNFFAKIRVSAGSKELMATDNEHEVSVLQEYIQEVAGHLKTLVKSTDAFVQSTADLAATYDEMGVPVGEWRTTLQQQGPSQSTSGHTMEMMSTLVEFASDFSTMLRRKHIEEEQKFGNQVYHLLNTVTAIQNALKQRRSVQVQYTATNKQIIDKDAALAKANKNLKPPEVTDKLRDERAELQQRSELEKRVLEECTQRLLRDAEKYKPVLIVLLKDAYLQYAKVQLAYNERTKKAFEQLIPYLDDSEASTSLEFVADSPVGGKPFPPPSPGPVAPSAPLEETAPKISK
ncbi:PX domain containing protein [Nitzschia inconspicua]|uniref:PX domain containing protein n=1 Tax=Nitzschia inconspicua TaxID=303405 RepID=A0A9K3KZA8_9STRA|nr:PX domain containing protein [Nitzschia inconspicua]